MLLIPGDLSKSFTTNKAPQRKPTTCTRGNAKATNTKVSNCGTRLAKNITTALKAGYKVSAKEGNIVRVLGSRNNSSLGIRQNNMSPALHDRARNGLPVATCTVRNSVVNETSEGKPRKSNIGRGISFALGAVSHRTMYIKTNRRRPRPLATTNFSLRRVADGAGHSALGPIRPALYNTNDPRIIATPLYVTAKRAGTRVVRRGSPALITKRRRPVIARPRVTKALYTSNTKLSHPTKRKGRLSFYIIDTNFGCGTDDRSKDINCRRRATPALVTNRRNNIVGTCIVNTCRSNKVLSSGPEDNFCRTSASQALSLGNKGPYYRRNNVTVITSTRARATTISYHGLQRARGIDNALLTGTTSNNCSLGCRGPIHVKLYIEHLAPARTRHLRNCPSK